MSEEIDGLVKSLRGQFRQNEYQSLTQELAAMALISLNGTLTQLRKSKPQERGELTRRYAVTITGLEQLVAYFKVYVVDALERDRVLGDIGEQ